MKTLCIGIVLMLVSATSFSQKKLTVVIDGIEEVKGSLFLGIYASDSTFLKKPCHAVKVEIKDLTEECSLELPEGEYAISVFQDLNGNSKMDTGMFGIPTEKYGFSNNAKGHRGSPSFEKAKFLLETDKVVRINLQ